MAADRGAARAPSRGRARTRAALGWAVVVPACMVGLSAVPSAAPASYVLAPTGTVAATSYERPDPPVGMVRPVVAPPLPIPTTAPTPAVPVAAAPAEWRPAAFTLDLPDGRAAAAVAAAMAQIGLPYVWGGDGPTAGDTGFDCSGLTTFAYAVAGVALPRTAHTQYYAGPHVPNDAPLQPGDLVFYGVPARVHHVGMYIGDGRMVNAPTFGKPVRTAYHRWPGDDYLGATRPAAIGQPLSGLLAYAPPDVAPPTTAAAPVFEAPPAPLPAPPAPAPPLAAAPLPAPADPPPPDAAPAPPTVTVPPTDVLPESPDSSTTGPPTTTAPPSSTTAPPETTTVAPQQARSTRPSATSDAVSAPEPTSTPVPTTPVPTTPAPTTTIEPTVTPTPETPEPAVTVAGTRVALSETRVGTDGLPRAAGIWIRPDRPVVRLASDAPLEGVDVGSSVSLTGADGSDEDYSVRSRVTATEVEAAVIVAEAASGEVVLLAPAGSGKWTVITAG